MLKKYEDMLRVFCPRCNQPRTICIPSGAAEMQNFFQVFPLGWSQEIFIDLGWPWPVNCNCGTHNSNQRTTILRAVPLFWKIISLSSCRTISNSSCIGGSSLSDRPSKEYRFKGIIVWTVAPPCDKSARIPTFVALPSVTVVESESRYQNWFLATLLEKSSEKSSFYDSKMVIIHSSRTIH